MCWITHKKATYETAKENIEVFKVCLDFDWYAKTLDSYYLEFKYELNKIYSDREAFECLCADSTYIHRGFHSYALSCTVIKERVISVWHDHYFLDSYGRGSIVVKGYIPAGAHYYLNERGEYVSDKICLIEVETL